MDFLIQPLNDLSGFNEISDRIRKYSRPISITGPSDSQKAHLCYALTSLTGSRGIFIAYNEMQARKIFDDFVFFYGEEAVLFPSREIMFHHVEAKSNDAVFQRLRAIDRILKGEFRFLVTSPEAFTQKLLPREVFSSHILQFTVGGKTELSEVSARLIEMGYERNSTVEGRGQFSVRGGILDISPVNSDYAVRIELFDDEIDSIRSFDLLTQRSVEKLDEARVIPARELIYTVEQQQRIMDGIRGELKSHLKELEKRHASQDVRLLKEQIEEDLEKLKSDYYFPGLDKYIPHILENPAMLPDYTGEAVVFTDEPVRFSQRVENLLLEHYENCKGLMEKGQLLPSGVEIYFQPQELERRAENWKRVYLSTMLTQYEGLNQAWRHSLSTKAMNTYEGNFNLLLEDIQAWKNRGNRVVVLAGPKGRGERLSETLSSNGIEAPYLENRKTTLEPGQVVISHGSLNRGFEYPEIGLVVVSGKELFGQEKQIRKARNKKEGSKIKAFTDLSVGDYVVHQAHGIGQYVGIEKLSVDNVKKDYLKIKYLEGGFLYIPTSQLDLIQKFIGSEGKSPKLNKLGGTEWAKTKKRVKESLRELAEELVRLYAQRQALQGHAFPKDTIWQNQLEELFPYEETDDQLKCIQEIKRDMETTRPMDRLLCGDVGYGKTEVAIRAVFKAVMDGKQVAYLVPTTILAQQQYNSFKERMKDFPVTVDVISRFRTQAEQKAILKNVKSGHVDILVGTHRLLQKDIQFHDLGLLVVDEEQRFGVTHKEKLKNLKPDVDVLTLTATPIPRTLHMSLVGIRDISVIEEPPEERYPVQTYVMEYNPDVIRDAISREMSRNGQVFYLYNRVRTIDLKAAELQAMVPDARIAVAHGQMDEKQLEDMMFAFINGEYDMLVCTTIIESGLDMPNVNTIIVEDADKMGLAQLYQLRGRVGRSNRLAFAYITYKKDKILSEVAEKRLQAIKEFTEFGSGFKIAMRDLEIRGAGNLLGQEQHGHMDTVGYEMYCRLLDEAVRELNGEPPKMDDMDITIDVNVSAYIDDSYIPAEAQKIEMYKRIASIQDEQDAVDVEDELVDRYGDPPAPARSLLLVAAIKVLARECGFASIQEKTGTVILQYQEGGQLDLSLLGKLMDKYRRKLMFTASNTPYITYKTNDISREDLLGNIKILLQDIIKLKYEK